MCYLKGGKMVLLLDKKNSVTSLILKWFFFGLYLKNISCNKAKNASLEANLQKMLFQSMSLLAHN